MQIQGRQKRPNECVRKSEGAHAYKQCVHEMITYTGRVITYTGREDMNKTVIRKEYGAMNIN